MIPRLPVRRPLAVAVGDAELVFSIRHERCRQVRRRELLRSEFFRFLHLDVAEVREKLHLVLRVQMLAGVERLPPAEGQVVPGVPEEIAGIET